MSKNDPAVIVPAAVRAAAAKADDLHKKAYQPGDQAPAPQEPAPPAPAAAPAPAAQAPPAPTPAPAPTESKITPQGNDQSWEHKYNSMRGRHDRLAKLVEDQQDQIANLQSLITTLKEPIPAVGAPAELKAETFLTKEEIDQYGPELVDVVKKAAKEVAKPEVDRLTKQVKDLESKLKGVDQKVTKGDREKVYDALDRDCPRWRELNNDENFLAWLGLKDPFAGVTRQVMLNDAYGQNDAPRVAAFFNGFLAEEAATAPAATHQPDSAAPVAKVPLEALAAPGRAKTAATTPAEKPIITRAQITQFYVDKAAGRFRGREDEASAFERQIFAAENEGRIR